MKVGLISALLFAVAAIAQNPRDVAPLRYWPAPLYWQPSQSETSLSALPKIYARADVNSPAANPVGSLIFVAMTPCRLVDTRAGFGFSGAFGPPSLAATATRSFPIRTSSTCSLPSNAQAYSLNVTVVPPGPLTYLTIWPVGVAQPNASTLNDTLGGIVANAAIIPAGNDSSGSVSVFVSDATNLIVDINGYYASPADLNENAAVGTGLANATGCCNTSFGFVALQNDTTGIDNTAFGHYALSSNTNGSENTASGAEALEHNTSGSGNTAFGAGALYSNTTGGNNTAIGFASLAYNTTGCCNAATSYQALEFNTTGNGNTASGGNALQSNTTGSDNTASGWSAMYLSTTGSYNTTTGYWGLLNNTTGESNTALGYDTLQNNTTGNNNIAIGAGSALSVSGGNSNNIHIGNQGASADSATIRIGASNIHTSFFAAGVRGITTVNNDAVPVVIDSNGQLGTVSSSLRFKEDVHDMTDASDGLLRLRPVTYRYKQPYSDGSKPIDYGLIAEEVAEVYPDLVVKNADGQIETVQYQKLTPMLLNELQKLQARVAALEAQLASPANR